MARFKDNDYHQTTLVAISFAEQIQPGSFEFAIHHLIENKLDLSLFHDRYHNDITGAKAYDPAMLLKVVLLAYSRGITSSRRIEQSCKTNATFMALSGHNEPHFTTIAGFVAGLAKEIADLFQQVLMVCDECGLIGRSMFAIDGCKLPSNASKEWSGTTEELTRKKEKMEKAVQRMLAKHREMDDRPNHEAIQQREQKQIETLEKNAAKIAEFLKNSEPKIGHRGKEVKSNITDNESAKMKTSHGTIQGYNGVAAVDDKHQVILHAEAFGEAQEQHLLRPMIEGVGTRLDQLTTAAANESSLEGIRLVADSGFHTEKNIAYVAKEGIDGYIADHSFRKRDPRFVDAERYKAQDNKQRKPRFTNEDFHYDENTKTCVCPAGKTLWLKNEAASIGDHVYVTFQGYRKDCGPCHLRDQCLKKSTQIDGRQVAFSKGGCTAGKTLTQKMIAKIDSDQGRHIYSQRLGIVEPVFGNIRETKGLRRFSLRGKAKVNAQWQLFCLVHNIEKIKNYGMAA